VPSVFLSHDTALAFVIAVAYTTASIAPLHPVRRLVSKRQRHCAPKDREVQEEKGEERRGGGGGGGECMYICMGEGVYMKERLQAQVKI